MISKESSRRFLKVIKQFGGHAEKGPAPHALKILEEVVELCIVSGCNPLDIFDAVDKEVSKGRSRGEIGEHRPKKAREEVADVIFTVDSYCYHMNINSMMACEEKLLILEERKWSPDDGGVLRRPR